MKAAGLLLTVILLLGFSDESKSQTYTEKLYNAYVYSKMDEWQKTIREMEKSYMEKKSDRLLFEMTHAYYGYIGFFISEGNPSKAINYIEKGESYLDYLIKKYPGWSEIHALRGAYYGFRMSIAPYKAIYLGPRSVELINKAIELDKESPFGYIEKANVEYHMPPVFGGSKQEAIRYYQKALNLLEKNGKIRTWIYLNTYINLATVYENMGDYRTAVEIYRKILSIEPDLVLVKNTLLPSAIKNSK
ncbi:MAG: tetratricopeptide repeat protein [Sphingobacteriales bacterium]|nr:tetratricopeptide repeat protein [Sphingobacteriales bacterium]